VGGVGGLISQPSRSMDVCKATMALDYNLLYFVLEFFHVQFNALTYLLQCDIFSALMFRILPALC